MDKAFRRFIQIVTILSVAMMLVLKTFNYKSGTEP